MNNFCATFWFICCTMHSTSSEQSSHVHVMVAYKMYNDDYVIGCTLYVLCGCTI